MAAPVATFILSGIATNTAAVVISGINYSPGVPFIILMCAYNEHQLTAAATVTSVTSAGQTWALRKRSNGSAAGGLETWWTARATALSAASVTVNFAGVYDDCSIALIGITGCANPSAPFDVNASLPAALSSPTQTWTPSFTGISTSSTDDLLLFITGCVSGGQTAASGFTEIVRVGNPGGAWSSNCKVDQRSVTALQSNATFTHGSALSTNSGTACEAIFDAMAGNAPAGGGASAAQARAMVLA